MSRSFAKLIKVAGIVLILSLSTNSFAGGLYGSVGYYEYPVKIVIGHNGHGKHYKHKRHHYKKHYHGHRYSHRRAYNYGHRAYHYNPPRRYCRSGY